MVQETAFNVGFLENLKILFVALLVYAIMYGILKNIKIFDGGKGATNAVIALLAAIIVSFTGVVTYFITYAINWFIIIVFIIFLMLVLFLFLGVGMGDITGQVKNYSKIIIIVFLLLFSIIFIKSFFALNNAFDLNEDRDLYEVDTSANIGVDTRSLPFNINFNSDLSSAIIFLLFLGGFAFFLGRVKD